MNMHLRNNTKSTESLCSERSRFYILFDVYHNHVQSLKSETRVKRGTEIKRRVTGSNKIQSNLWRETTLGENKMWSLLTSDLSPEVRLIKKLYWRTIYWSLFGGNLSSEVVFNTGLTVPANWRNVLLDNKNKMDLFNFLADEIPEHCTDDSVIVTKEDKVLRSKENVFMSP